jgi:hypothetical protein
MPEAIAAVRSEWRKVHGDLASMTRANAWAMRSMRDSSARMMRSAGSSAATWSRASRRFSRSQNSASFSTAPKAWTRAGSNQLPDRLRAIAPALVTPYARQKTSTVWARQRMRDVCGISSRFRPLG